MQLPRRPTRCCATSSRARSGAVSSVGAGREFAAQVAFCRRGRPAPGRGLLVALGRRPDRNRSVVDIGEALRRDRRRRTDRLAHRRRAAARGRRRDRRLRQLRARHATRTSQEALRDDRGSRIFEAGGDILPDRTSSTRRAATAPTACSISPRCGCCTATSSRAPRSTSTSRGTFNVLEACVAARRRSGSSTRRRRRSTATPSRSR